MKKCPRCGYSPSKKVRSDPQNKYYWGCVVQILSDELGYTKDEVHEMLKREFIKTILVIKNKRTGEERFIENTGTTSGLNTTNFEHFLSNVRAWASAQLGIYIAEPNEEIK